MAKINLLTIHYGKCYGAVMQTYATCKLLEAAGHKVNVINIISPKLRGQYKSKNYWRDCVREFQFWWFKKKYFSHLTKKIYAVRSEDLPNADITVVGSDQVWNRDITGCFCYTFFLDFVPVSQKKYSLASSFGKSEWAEDESYTRAVQQFLDMFDGISVREDSGKTILKNVFQLDSIQVLDPTLGYGKFDNLVPCRKNKPQIFTFLLNPSAEAMAISKRLSEVLNRPLNSFTRFTARFKRGPLHWLSDIKNSDYVITDSFHGLALSIIFHKNFFVLCANEKKFTRLKSLLSLLGLEHRYIKSIDDLDSRINQVHDSIDYASVDGILEIERKKYRDFISAIK